MPLPTTALLGFALAMAGCKESSNMILYAFGFAGILAGAVMLMRLALNYFSSYDRTR